MGPRSRVTPLPRSRAPALEPRKVSQRPSEETSNGEKFSVEGVTLQMVNGGVPVVSMDKDSIFDECASWLLQIAANSTAKAISLFDYADDKDITEAVRQLRKSDEGILIARMTGARRSNIFAAGDGKRAVMISLALALIVHENMSPQVFASEARQYQDSLEEPCRSLALKAMRLYERQTRRGEKRQRDEDTSRHQKQPRLRINLRRRPVLEAQKDKRSRTPP